MPIRRSHSLIQPFLIALAALAFTSQVSAQALNSNAPTVALTATLGEILTVAATPSAVNFTLVSGGTAPGSAPIVITTTWVLGAGRANVVLDGYFASATAALTNVAAAANIPSSAVLGQDLLGTPVAFSPFTQTGVVGTAGTALTIFTVPLTALNRAFIRSDTLNLEIALTAAPLLQLPAAVYTGTLTLQAQAL